VSEDADALKRLDGARRAATEWVKNDRAAAWLAHTGVGLQPRIGLGADRHDGDRRPARGDGGSVFVPQRGECVREQGQENIRLRPPFRNEQLFALVDGDHHGRGRRFGLEARAAQRLKLAEQTGETVGLPQPLADRGAAHRRPTRAERGFETAREAAAAADHRPLGPDDGKRQEMTVVALEARLQSSA
jgi:hypothetical protein